MDIVKVFGDNSKNIELQKATHRKNLHLDVAYIEPILVLLNAIEEVFH